MADEKRLIELLAGDGRDVVPVRWPGGDQHVGLVIPTCQDMQDAWAEARKHLATKLNLSIEADANAGILQEEEEAQILALCVLETTTGPVRSTDGRRLFASPRDVRRRLTVDQRLFFIAHLNKLQEAQAEGWPWPDDGDSRERMAKALDMPPGTTLSQIADAVVDLVDIGGTPERDADVFVPQHPPGE